MIQFGASNASLNSMLYEVRIGTCNRCWRFIVHALIIEDEGMFAAIIEFVLRDCGFDTFDNASSSQEAIDAAVRHCPQLITADVHLASGTGIDAVRAICPDSRMPVIFITGRPTAEVRAEISKYSVLSKPFSEQTLTYAVAAAMRH
jgi:DNA-binding response OmpR family regulator